MVPTTETPSGGSPLAFVLFVSYFGHSCCRNVYGATLLPLAENVRTSLERVSLVFTSVGVGGIVGSLTFGHIFDRTERPLLTLFTAQLGCGLATCLLAVCRNLCELLLVSALQSFCVTATTVGCNVLVIRIWRRRARAYVTAMHFMYSLGGFVIPLLLQWSELESSELSRLSSRAVDLQHRLSTEAVTTRVYVNASLRNQSLSRQRVDLLRPYLAVGGFMQLTAFCCLALHFGTQCLHVEAGDVQRMSVNGPGNVKANDTTDASKPPHPLRVFFSTAVMILFNFFFGGKEVTYTGLLVTYVQRGGVMSATAASYLLSSFFFMSSVARFLLIPLSSKVAPRKVIAAGVLFGLTFTLPLSFVSPPPPPEVVWTSNLLVGFSLSATFFMALLWAGDFTVVTARFTAANFISYTIGSMTVPALTAALVQNRHPSWFAHVNSIAMIACLACIVVLLLLTNASPTPSRRLMTDHSAAR